jgi:hypothetical protein
MTKPLVIRSAVKAGNEGLLKPLAVTVPVALRITGLGRTTLYGLIADGIVDSVTVRRRRLISFASLERLISGPPPGTNAALVGRR